MNEPFPVLRPNIVDVHIWWIALDDIGDEAAAVLAPEELTRAGRFRYERDRRRWIGAHAALRQILAGYGGVPAAELRFRRGRSGKPELEPERFAPATDLAPLRFNLTHARERAAVAVTLAREIGVDLEPIDPAIDRAATVSMMCTPAECARLAALPETERPAALAALWTQKEAYLKAIGVGMSREPRTVEIVPVAGGGAAVNDPRGTQDGVEWRITSLDAGAGWCAAVATAEPHALLREFRWASAIVNDRAIAS
jgi:4'-phosphopantetheinyl transferase